VPRLSDLRPGLTELPASDSAVAEAALRFLERDDGARPVAAAEPASAYRSTPAAPLAVAPTGADRPLFSSPAEGRGATWLALTQFRDSYIVAQDSAGLMLVDQHAAHERVLFEAYLRAAEADRVEVQQLLFPVTVELPPAELLLVEDEADELRRLGFRVELFGENTIRVDAVPAIAKDLDAAKLVRAVLGEAGQLRSARSGVAELRHSLVTTAACHAAIKINHPLTREAMQCLLDDLSRLRNPTTCPHGRPVLFRLTLEEIERAFRRR
jgi:DNA mismatch repair protein MutL